MNAPSAALYDRAKRLGFPAVVVHGTVCSGAPAWELWLAHDAAPASLEQAHHQLDEIETRFRENAQKAADRVGPTALEEGLAADYVGSEQEQRDLEAAEALLAREDEE